MFAFIKGLVEPDDVVVVIVFLFQVVLLYAVGQLKELLFLTRSVVGFVVLLE